MQLESSSLPAFTNGQSAATDRRLETWLWAVAVVLGFTQVWLGRQQIFPDGVAYLDMGQAFWRGDWATFVNAYWSPLYPVLIGFGTWLTQPSADVEFAMVGVVSFVTYLGALAAFHFLLTQLMRYHEMHAEAHGTAMLPRRAWILIGYTLFLWSAFGLITIDLKTPDICVSACVYLASGLLLRIKTGAPAWPSFPLLGVVLGLGYLTKAALLPVGFAFLAGSWLARRGATGHVVSAGIVLLLIVTPWAVTLSLSKGRVTVGDTARVNYAWALADTDLSDVPDFFGSTLAGTRQVMRSPTVHEFATPVGGSYPPLHDPSYWVDNPRFAFNLGQQIRLLVLNAKLYRALLFDLNGSLAVGLLVLFVVGGRRWRGLMDLLDWTFLLLPVVAALAMYSLVYSVPRYLAPFLVVLYLCLYAAVRLERSRQSARVFGAVGTAIAVMFLFTMGSTIARSTYEAARQLLSGSESRDIFHDIADSLAQHGLEPGDTVASMRLTSRRGVTFMSHAKFAHLARTKIVAAITSSEREPVGQKRAAIDAVARTGARVIVAEHVGDWTSIGPWETLGDTGYFAYFIPR